MAGKARRRTVEQEGEDLGIVVGASDPEVRRQAAARLSHDLAAKTEAIAALAHALMNSAPRMSPSYGPCWCPASVKHIPAAESEHGRLCAEYRNALRLAGVLQGAKWVES